LLWDLAGHSSRGDNAEETDRRSRTFEWDFRGRRPRLERAIGVNRPYLCKLGIRDFAVDEANDLQEY
jgi:hypothetical protein